MRDEHRRGVDDVLARRAVVDVVGRLAADGFAQRPDERLGRIARRMPGGDDRGHVEPLDVAGLGDRPCHVRRDDADERLGIREGALGREHRLDPDSIRDEAAQLVGHEDRVEAHGSKHTVSPAPCSRMSKRSEPSASATATSVERRSGSTPASTGSVCVRLGLVREVDAGHDLLQEPAREHGDLEAWCAAAGRGFGTTTANRPPSRVSLRTSPTPAGPELDDRVGDRVAGAVENAPVQPDPGPVEPAPEAVREPDEQEGPDRL